ncbi:hypothetical protein [Brevibacillus migulae]|uniref:hypothetical protein n=1 Tax=Brevibacillus migulae TaxID=1644114 RepID=UPI00142F9267|nr:hypothetical protein [Brevibacillus migulae]
MKRLQMSEEEYALLMEKVYKILSRTEQLDHVTHHWMWEVWRTLHFSLDSPSQQIGK